MGRKRLAVATLSPTSGDEVQEWLHYIRGVVRKK
jgi:hypothetical protein